MFPTPGHRNIRLETDVTCTDDRKLQIPDLNSMVLVARAEKPIITISGSDGLARDEHNYTRGVKLFQGVQIISQTRKEAEELDDDIQNALFKDVASNRYRLDSCTIKPLQKPLDIEDEKLKIPVNLINDLMLTYTNTAEGLVISGAEVIGEYEDVIRSIQYIHRNPQNINSRTFSLICSELNGRFVSNDFTVTLDIIHTVKHAQVPQAHAQKESFVKNSAQKLVGKQTNFHSAVGVAQTSNVGVTLIVVVCVGFLLFMIILGVIRIRAAHQRTQVVSVDGEKDEMEWDNSALTITVNPMEQEGAPAPEVFGDEAEIGLHVSDSETEDDEDEAHYDHGDDLESSEEEQEKLLYRDLEWDDSDL